jgi:hypothetical protein
VLYSNKINLLGLDLESIVSTRGLLSLNKVIAVTKGYATWNVDFEFPAGTLEDETPLMNIALERCPFTERLDMYFDIGATDPARDLDVTTVETMYPLYVDPAYSPGEDGASAGALPPKMFMMRCLSGGGLVYLNASPILDLKTNKAAPLNLHANAGLIYYTFPRADVHAARSGNTRVSLALVSVFLRTFETSNRFQISLFK